MIPETIKQIKHDLGKFKDLYSELTAYYNKDTYYFPQYRIIGMLIHNMAFTDNKEDDITSMDKFNEGRRLIKAMCDHHGKMDDMTNYAYNEVDSIITSNYMMEDEARRTE